jgi:hypothetical protein
MNKPTNGDKAPRPAKQPAPKQKAVEAGAERKKPDPTRYGDWEKNGRCIDF